MLLPYTLLPYISSAQGAPDNQIATGREIERKGGEEKRRGKKANECECRGREGKGQLLLEKCHQQEIKRQLNGVPPPPPLTGRDLTGEEIDSREEEEQTARTWGG